MILETTTSASDTPGLQPGAYGPILESRMALIFVNRSMIVPVHEDPSSRTLVRA